jgi:hypothetical protein
MDDIRFLRSLVPEMDLEQDEPWRPCWNPYEGRITPSWQITAAARWRITARGSDSSLPIRTEENT